MLIVSDHALLRLIERGHGVDVEGIRAALQLRLDRASTAAGKIGPPEYHVVLDGLRYIVRNGTVTTVMLNDCPIGRRRQGIARA